MAKKISKKERELIKKLDEYKMTPERMRRCEDTARALHTMTAEDWFRPFTI